MPDFKKIEKIAENQLWRSTWRVTIDEKPYLAKIIDCNDTEKLKDFIQSINQQLTLFAQLTDITRASICLFSRKIDLPDNQVAFCREYVEGESLDSVLTNKDFSCGEALDLFLRIAEIMAVAHNTYQVSHGDLKPANIIIAQNIPVIIDWDTMTMNTATMAINAQGKTITAEQISGGTPKYMPPEQCKGEPIDEQCDIYALGIILYQLLNHGKTPFDEPPFNAMNTLQLFGAKEQTLNSLSARHPELNVPEELSAVISKAIAPDRNQRFSTIIDFINSLNACRMFQDPTSPRPGLTHVPKPTPALAPELNPEPAPDTSLAASYNFVLVGHPHAGKTVLGTGLYAMSNENFKVTTIDPETKSHAINTKSDIQNGRWPAKTSDNTITRLQFCLLNKSQKAIVHFDEYAGEWLSRHNYFQDIIKQPDGALMLFNTNFVELRDPLQRNTMMEDFSLCINYLCNLPNHPPIAFVVTAADRLSTDLKDQAPEFEKYAREITDSLSNHPKCLWKRFDVSICGELDNQSTPRLDPQNTHLPFLWLMDELTARKRQKVIRLFLKMAAVLIMAALLGALGRWYWERRQTTAMLDNLAAVQAEFGSQNTETALHDKYLPKLLEERLRYCSQAHISKDNRRGSRLAPCDDSCQTRHFFFPDRKEAYDQGLRQLETAIDTVNIRYLTLLLNKALKEPNAKNFASIQEQFSKWVPLQDLEQKDKDKAGTLAFRCEHEIKPAEARYSCEQLRESLNNIIQGKEEIFPKDISSKISRFNELLPHLPENERQSKEDEIKNLHKQARQVCEMRYAENLLKVLQDLVEHPEKGLNYDFNKGKEYVELGGTSSLPTGKYEEYKTKIRGAMTHAREAIYSYHVNQLIHTINSFDGSAEDLAELIDKYNNFVRNKPELSPELLANNETKLQQALQARLERLADQKCQEFHDQQMASKKPMEENITSVFKEFIYPKIPADLATHIQTRIEEKLRNTGEAWRKQEQQRVMKFIDTYEREQIDNALAEFCRFSQKEQVNPYFEQAEKMILKRINTELQDCVSKIKEYKISSGTFSDLKTLCASISSKCKGSTLITNSPVHAWANNYKKWKDENPYFTVTIHDIQAQISYKNPDNTYFKVFKYTGNTNYTYKSSGWSSTRFSSKEWTKFTDDPEKWPPKEDQYELGKKIEIKIEVYDENGLSADIKIDDLSMCFYPGIDEPDNGYVELKNKEHKVFGRLHLDVSGEPFFAWLKSNPLPTID